MLAARGHIENRQAIVRIGLQPLVPAALSVEPSPSSFEIPVHEYRALLDTGAQRTCLCRKVIADEGLKFHSKKPIQNVHGVERHYLYWVQIGFVCERLESRNSPDGQTTYFGLADPLEVIDIADNFCFDAIIGMDLISRCDFTLERDGSFGNYILYLAGHIRHKMPTERHGHEHQYLRPHLPRRSQGYRPHRGAALERRACVPALWLARRPQDGRQDAGRYVPLQ